MERDEHDEGSVDEDEVDNTADVFQIAALLDKRALLFLPLSPR